MADREFATLFKTYKAGLRKSFDDISEVRINDLRSSGVGNRDIAGFAGRGTTGETVASWKFCVVPELERQFLEP